MLTLRWDNKRELRKKLDEIKKRLGLSTYQATLEQIIDEFYLASVRNIELSAKLQTKQKENEELRESLDCLRVLKQALEKI